MCACERTLSHTHTCTVRKRKDRRRHYGASQSHCRECFPFFCCPWEWKIMCDLHPSQDFWPKVLRIRNFSLCSFAALGLGSNVCEMGWGVTHPFGGVKSVEVWGRTKLVLCCCSGVCCLIRLVNDSQWAH